jgi:hypothetical protein
LTPVFTTRTIEGRKGDNFNRADCPRAPNLSSFNLNILYFTEKATARRKGAGANPPAYVRTWPGGCRSEGKTLVSSLHPDNPLPGVAGFLILQETFASD